MKLTPDEVGELLYCLIQDEFDVSNGDVKVDYSNDPICNCIQYSNGNKRAIYQDWTEHCTGLTIYYPHAGQIFVNFTIDDDYEGEDVVYMTLYRFEIDIFDPTHAGEVWQSFMHIALKIEERFNDEEG